MAAQRRPLRYTARPVFLGSPALSVWVSGSTLSRALQSFGSMNQDVCFQHRRSLHTLWQVQVSCESTKYKLRVTRSFKGMDRNCRAYGWPCLDTSARQ